MNGFSRTQDTKTVLKSLAKQLAEQELPESKIESLGKTIISCKHPVTGVDICRMGICIDIQLSKPVEEIDLQELLAPFKGGIRNVEMFPHGITIPEGSLVRVTQSLDSL